MSRYISRRLLLMLFCVFAVSVLVFIGLRSVQGDLAVMYLSGGTLSGVDETDLVAMRHELGLDAPVPVQYVRWLGLALRGKFGDSAYSGEPAAREIAMALPVTLELALLATALAWLLGVPLGVVAAVKQDRVVDVVLRLVSILGLALPSFWLGALFVTLPAVWFGWTPLKPFVSLLANPVANVARLFWPALSLALGMAAWLMRMTRGMMIEVLQQDYVRTARSKGLSNSTVLVRHALRNSLIPVLSMSGMQLAGLLGGTIVIEELFMLPGLGRLLVRALLQRDYAVVQAGVLLTTGIFILMNLMVDVMYGWLDPRIRCA